MRVRLALPLPGPFVLTGGSHHHRNRKMVRAERRTARSTARTAAAVEQQTRMMRDAQIAGMAPAEATYARARDNEFRASSFVLFCLAFFVLLCSIALPYLWPVTALLVWWFVVRVRNRSRVLAALKAAAEEEKGI